MRRLAAPLFAVSLVFAASSAVATPSAKDKADAKQLVVQAQKELKAGKASKAAELFGKANDLDPSPQVQLDQARALVDAKHLVKAARILDEVAAQSKGADKKKVRESAMQLRTEIEIRIPHVTITVAGGAGAKVTIDGETVDASGPVAVDPGEHEVVAKVGTDVAKQDFTIEEGKTQAITLTIGAAAPPPEKKEGGGGLAVVPAVIAFGIGAAATGVGIAFGVLAFDEANKVKAVCPVSPCAADPDTLTSYDLSIANGNVSTAMFVVGGAGIATGIVILSVSAALAGKKDPAKAAVKPYFGPTQVGVYGKF